MKSYCAFSLVLILNFTVQSLAGESSKSITDAGMPAECAEFAAKVSSSEGNWRSENQFGCLGAFQFCPGTFERYYSGSRQSFLNDPSAQVKAWIQFQKDQWNLATRNNLMDLIGQQVCLDNKCFTVDASSILMACQFGCGKNGKLANFISNNNSCIRGTSPGRPNGGSSITNDGNGVCVAEYLHRGNGYNVSCFAATANCGPGDFFPNSPVPMAGSPPLPVATDVMVPEGAI